MDPAVVRLSAYWDAIEAAGYAELDWQLAAARSGGVPVLLTVGMKAMRWPEFYIPGALTPPAATAGPIGAEPGLSGRLLAHLRRTAERYRDEPALFGWQVENEPFNRSGPSGWWIAPDLLRAEIAAVRELDQRPIAVNAFAHFNRDVDRRSRVASGWCKPSPEAQALAAAPDILGLDVYSRMRHAAGGDQRTLKAARDCTRRAGRWRRAAQRAGKQAWIIECQAEPWELSPAAMEEAASFGPDDAVDVFAGLVRAGFDTVLLWGAEHWLWRAEAGDRSWLEMARRLIGRA